MLRSKKGISLLEIMIGILIISIVMFGLTKLLTVNSKSINVANYQQNANQAAQYILNRIEANLIVESTPPYSSSAAHYNQGNSYTADSTAPAVLCNQGQYCTQQQVAKYDLYQWKQYLASLKINSLQGVVCLDNSNYGIPTATNPNCAAGGSNLVIKLVWQTNLAANESAGIKNYLLIPVVTPTNLALFKAESSASDSASEQTPGSLSSYVGIGSSFSQCYQANCSGMLVDGACNGSNCSGSLLFGNCNGSSSCQGVISFGSCNSSSDCSGSTIFGDCNSNNCSGSVISGSCNMGNCSNSVMLGSCYGTNCTNSVIYGNCTGNCSGSVVLGNCWGSGCPSATTNTLYQSLSYDNSTKTITGLNISTLGGVSLTQFTDANCANNATCSSALIDGNCGNGGTCSSSIIDGNCGNNANCSNSLINGDCNNSSTCNNSLIISGTCQNNSSCQNSTIIGSCAINGSCCANGTNCTGTTCYTTSGIKGSC